MKLIEKGFIGIRRDLKNNEYHSLKDYISRSSLMDFAKTPYHYYAKHLANLNHQKDSTPAMNLGSAFHSYILEPHLFYEEFLVKKEKVFLKDVGREAYDAYKKSLEKEENSAVTMITAEQFQIIKEMKERFDSSEYIKDLLHGGIAEQSIFFKDEETGLLLKSRPDLLHSNIVIDLKTTADCSKNAMNREIFKSGYDIQMAMIRDGIWQIENNKIENFILICIETKYPYNAAIYVLDTEIIDNASRKYKSLLKDLRACVVENHWPDYGVQQLHLPTWEVFNKLTGEKQ